MRSSGLRVFRRWTRNLSSVVLRPYQEDCIQSCLEALKAGYTRIGVSAPTGSGKTTMFISLLARLSPPPNRPLATRSLIIVNSIELARQATENVHRLFPDMTVQVEQGQRNRADGAADVTVATYQTLMQPNRLLKFDRERLKAVIIDEAHHAAAPSYRKILSHFDPAVKYGENIEDSMQASGDKTFGVPIIGFSATFSRHDGLALGSVFERIVYHRDFLEMIKEKWLCHVRFTSVKADIDLSDVTVSSRSGDFNATSLAHVVNTPTVNELVVKTWIDRAFQKRKSTLIFCVNVAHVITLTNVFREAGVDARYLHGKTPAFERKVLLESFRAGEFPVLVNCAILTEGADVPNIDCVIVAKPTRSKTIFAQIVGRGMRLSPQTGKEDCHIIDFVDSMGRVGGVVTAPTLFGLEPDSEITDQTLEDLQAGAKTAESKQHKSSPPDYDLSDPVSVVYTDYDNPWSLAHGASGSPYIAKISPNAWVACGRDTYLLECLGKGFIKIQPAKPGVKPEDITELDTDGAEDDRAVPVSSAFSSPHFEATFTPTIDRDAAERIGLATPYLRKRHVLLAETLERAVKGCDQFAATKVITGPRSRGLLRTAKWRQAPASDAQKAFLSKRLGLKDPSADVPENPDPDTSSITTSESDTPNSGTKNKISVESLTKGEAANIINRLKHGAKGHYQTKKKELRRAAIIAEKQARKLERETVRVGPLRA